MIRTTDCALAVSVTCTSLTADPPLWNEVLHHGTRTCLYFLQPTPTHEQEPLHLGGIPLSTVATTVTRIQFTTVESMSE